MRYLRALLVRILDAPRCQLKQLEQCHFKVKVSEQGIKDKVAVLLVPAKSFKMSSKRAFLWLSVRIYLY